MADRTKIEWTDASWNPIRARNRATGGVGHYCARVSDGCRNCYAERMQPRFGNPIRYAAQDIDKVELFLDEAELLKPLRWKRPRMIFVCSMTDLFADFVPDEWIDRVFAVMALCLQHTFQVLTKRPERMRAYLKRDRRLAHTNAIRAIEPRECQPRTNALIAISRIDPDAPIHEPLPNVWLGVSVEDQPAADERIPILLNTPAALRWISAEPLLGPIDLTSLDDGERDGTHLHFDALTGLANDGHDSITGVIGQPDPRLDWVVAGGESGPGARPLHPDWARSLRDQCAAAGVPFLFKQWGEWAPQIGAVDGWAIDDNPEISRFDHREWEDGRWSEVFRPMWCDFQDGNYDEEQTVSRIGKARAGRLLDGVPHDAFPATSTGARP